MLQDRFIQLSLIAFTLVLSGFVVRGMTRAFVGGRAGDLLAAPLIAGGFVLIVVLTVVSVLGFAGYGPLAGTTSDNG